MKQVEFKTKIKTMYDPKDVELYKYVEVPKFKRGHCDMPAFRKHKTFGAYANSDMFESMLERACKEKLQYGSNRILHLDKMPPGVSIDKSKFLAVVSFDL